MFDVGRLVRSYFDAVITCSAIRWLQPGELWWGAANDDADSVRDSVAYLLDQAIDGIEEQVLLVPELLLAAAQGKVPTGAHEVVLERAELLSAAWPDEPGFSEVRGAVEVGMKLLRSRQRSRAPLRVEHSGAECRSGVGLHAGQDVLVHGHREGRAGVAEAFADDLHGDAGLQQDRGVGVAQVVEADASQLARCAPAAAMTARRSRGGSVRRRGG